MYLDLETSADKGNRNHLGTPSFFPENAMKYQPTENETSIPTSALQLRPLARIGWIFRDIPSVPRCCQADHWSACTLYKGAALPASET